MGEYHIGNKKKLRRCIRELDNKGIKHTLTNETKIPRHTGLTVITDGKEAVVA